MVGLRTSFQMLDGCDFGESDSCPLQGHCWRWASVGLVVGRHRPHTRKVATGCPCTPDSAPRQPLVLTQALISWRFSSANLIAAERAPSRPPNLSQANFLRYLLAMPVVHLAASSSSYDCSCGLSAPHQL